MRQIPRERSPLMVLVLTIVTLGIYYLYWVYVTSRDIDEFLGESDLPPLVHLLLFLCTGTLWGYVWDVLTARRIVRMQQRVGLPLSDDTVIYLACDILGAGPIGGLGLVVPVLQQSRLNEIYRRGVPASYGV